LINPEIKPFHIPALLKETIELLDPKPGKTHIDATLGGGGHSEEILKRLNGKCKLIGIDQDSEAIEESRKKLSKYGESVILVKDNFVNIKEILKKLNIEKVNGILFDLGISSHQIDKAERGFSLRSDGPLDMRMDKSGGMTAANIVASYSKEDLAGIIKEFGEERSARRIAKSIVERRDEKPIKTTRELAETIEKTLAGIPPQRKLDSVTRTFQALRIAVNDELSKLSRALRDSIDILDEGGRLIVISYHSLEDRIAKTIFKDEASDCICPPRNPVCTCSHRKRVVILTKKPVTPDEAEVKSNPRARSAKLRAIERIAK
jgi:16S rRNA (cytosine1402-N4)-methyltransferase